MSHIPPPTHTLRSGQNRPLQPHTPSNRSGWANKNPSLFTYCLFLQRCVILGTNMLIMYVGSKPDTADLTVQIGPLTSHPHSPHPPIPPTGTVNTAERKIIRRCGPSQLKTHGPVCWLHQVQFLRSALPWRHRSHCQGGTQTRHPLLQCNHRERLMSLNTSRSSESWVCVSYTSHTMV